MAPTRRRRNHRRTRRTLAAAAVGVVVSLTFLAAAAIAALRFVNPIVTAVQLERRIEAVFEPGTYRVQRVFVPLNRISPNLRRAVIAAEDGRFYEHHGLDWIELRKALRESAAQGRSLRGASTITQQLVKNLFLSTRRSVVRKAAEVPLALLAELLLPKARILELYLNVVEWGPGVFGAEAAARYHYGISSARLSPEQAARLAACLPSPQLRRPQRMDRYAGTILRRMRRMGY